MNPSKLQIPNCCQVLFRFPGQFQKNTAKYRKKSALSVKYFFMGLRRIYFIMKPFHNIQNLISVQTAPEKLKIVKKCFFRCLSATFRQNWGPFDQRYFLRPLLSYFAEFSATWQLVVGGWGGGECVAQYRC